MDSESFLRVLLDGLIDCQRRGMLCDTVLRAQGGEVLANSGVLAAASAKLQRELISSGTEPGTQHIIELPDFLAEDVCRMLEYVSSALPGDCDVDLTGVITLCDTLEIPVPPEWIDSSTFTQGALNLDSLESLMMSSENFAVMLLHGFHDFQHRGQLCDTTLRAQGGDITAHSIILAAVSAKLHRELIRPDAEPGTQHIIELPDFTVSEVRQMIKYIYSGTPAKQIASIAGAIALCETLEIILPPEWQNGGLAANEAVVLNDELLFLPDDHTYKCDVCSRGFKRLAALRLHARCHSSQASVKTEKFSAVENGGVAGESFVYNDELLSDLTSLDPLSAAKSGPYKQKHRVCELCGAQFDCNAHLYAHRRREHLNREEFAYVCDCCDRRFEFPSLLFEHRSMHDITFCDTCGIQFATFREVYTHRVNMHSGGALSTRNLCRVCARSFDTRQQLRQHRLTHLQCRVCGRCFLKASKLRRHEPCCQRRSSKRAVTDARRQLENGSPSEGYLCVECGKHFDRRSSFISHKKVHVSMEYYESSTHHNCPLCGQAFLKPSRLVHHMATCQQRLAKHWVKNECGQMSMVCGALDEVSVMQPTEDETAAIKQQLDLMSEQQLDLMSEQQLDLMSEQQQFVCADCGRVFEKQASLASHKKVHAPDEFRCSVCDKVFPKRYYLVAHERKHSNDRPFSCPQCGLCFKQPGQVHRHALRRHNGGLRPFMCQTCGRTFTVKSDLRDHSRIHTGERAHMCDQCGRRFRTRGILRVHERQHTGVMPFSCTYCGRRFAQLSNRLKHEVIHTGVFPLRCDLCGRGFADTSALKRHELYHTGARPHSCPTCGRTFALKSSLKAHVLIHDKIRQHTCPICQKAFVLRNGLMRHLKIHIKKGMQIPELTQPNTDTDVKPQIVYLTGVGTESGDEMSYEPEVMHEMYIAENVVEVAME